MSEAAVCLIQLAKLGDFIQSTALIHEVRRKWPGREIFLVLAERPAWEAARLSGLADHCLLLDEDKKFLDPALEKKFEAVFVLNSHPKAAELGEKITADHYFGPRSQEGRLIFPPAWNFLKSLMKNRRLGSFNLVDLWRGHITDAQGPGRFDWPGFTPAASLLEDGIKVGFQLGGRNHLRRWPMENFAAMLERMSADLDFTVYLFGSKTEAPLGRRLGKMSNVTSLMGRTDLAQLAAAISRMDLVVSGDTGVLHLAAVLGRPTLGLFFGPAYGPETGPYGQGHLIYQALAPCAPCLENGSCRKKTCEALPDPNIAALLALAKIKQQTAPKLTLPAGRLVWETRLDDFGQSLRPWGRPRPTLEQAAALLIREWGRSVIRPGYQHAFKNLKDDLAAFNWEGAGLDFAALARRVEEVLAESPGRETLKDFLEKCQNLLSAIGPSFANN